MSRDISEVSGGAYLKRASATNISLPGHVLCDGEIIVLKVEQHSLEMYCCIFQVLQRDLLKGLVVTLESECTAKHLCVEPFYTKEKGKHSTLTA